MSEGLTLKIGVQSGAATQGLREISNAAREASGAFAGFKTMLGGFGQIASAIGPIGVAVAAASAAAVSAARAVASVISDLDKAGKSAQEAGASIEKFSALSFATSFSDVPAEELAVSFKTLSSKMADALAGGKEATATFSRLGVAFQNVDGSLRGPDAVFRDIVASMSRMSDGAEKTAIAVDLFGRSGQRLIPIINDGVDGLDQWAERAREAGAVISGDLAKQADDFGDSMQLLKEQFKGIFIAIASELLPTLNQLASSFQALIRDSGALRAAMAIAEETARVFIFLGEVGVGTFQTLGVAVSAFTKNVVSELKFLGSTFQSAFDGIVQSAKAYGNLLSDTVTVGPVAALKEFSSTLRSVFEQSLDSVGGAMAKRSSGFVSIWRDAANQIADIWKKRVGDLISPFSGSGAMKSLFAGDNPVLNTPGKLDKDTTETLARINDEYAKATMSKLELLDYEREERIRKLREQLKDEEEFQGAKLGIERIYAQKRREVVEDQRRAQADIELATIRGRSSGISGDKDLTQAQKKAELVPILQQENQLVAQQIEIYRARSQDGTLSDESRIEASRKINELEQERVRTLQQIRDLQADTFGSTFRRGMIEMFDEFSNVSRNLANGALKAIRGAVDGITDGIMGAIDGTKSWGQVFQQFGLMMIRTLIQIAVQAAVVAALVALIPGLAGFLEIGGAVASVGKRATGGMVTNGLYQLGEEGPEYVLNAKATSAIGLPALQQLNAGRIPVMAAPHNPQMGGGGGAGWGNLRIGVGIVDKRSDYDRWVESNHFERSVMEVVRRNG